MIQDYLISFSERISSRPNGKEAETTGILTDNTCLNLGPTINVAKN